MISLRNALAKGSGKTPLIALLSLIALLIPTFAFAAGAEASVALEFSESDKIYLYISLGLGVLALVFGWWLRSSILKLSAGDEKMQEVGMAIHQGAIAYLKRQVTTMGWFVMAIAVVLFLIYSQSYKSQTLGLLTAVSFILGVVASYVAGYIGMDVAVRGNMRTAHAALSSYALALKVAFRSGAVAGMFTVGMGLLGATIIFLVAGKDAMKLLIGFGFGGSLAALFMRVGGGIFTKAADVGADLVGKVEAGIPEDDPRNPATIADNVGDNVGDCAGMAADVFESYEVTLVAAIVLGAATASLFDQSTWMKLILFALMARGAGIIASIIGILMMKGSDDLDSDPLKAIRKGFMSSAVIAVVLTAGVAWYMMGGQGEKITTNQLVSQKQEQYKVYQQVQAVKQKIAKEKGILPEAVTQADLLAHSGITDLKLPDFMKDQIVQQFSTIGEEEAVRAFDEKLEGYKAVKLESLTDIVVVTSGGMTGAAASMKYESAAEGLGKARVFELKRTPAANDPANAGKPPVAQTIVVLTGDPEGLKKQITDANTGGQKVEIVGAADGLKPTFFKNSAGKLAAGIPGDPAVLRFSFQNMMSGSAQVYKGEKADIEKLFKDREALSNRVSAMFQEASKLKGAAQTAKQEEANKLQMQLADIKLPTPMELQSGLLKQKEVPWYLFLACIGFGILMAFAIEILTDYYVSTHKKPVQEIAGVSNAGPAPMIIQGFALGLESSVFSVFAIVISLIMPMVIFNPAEYGGYILSFYGIALVGLGLLTTTGYILAMDTFGPISDNAQGVFEMSGAGHKSPEGSKAVQRLDAAGNTTKALTKGFAIATAVVAAVALFHSFVEDAKLTGVGMRLDIPEIFLGLMIGGAAPYLFSAFSINAVGRSAFELINEVRRQFREDPGIMAGTSKPNYAVCVAIVTKAAQKELLGPGVLAIALPVAVGFGFSIGKAPVMINGQEYNLVGAQALGGFLAGCIVSGQLLAVLLANSGGMWDNAKKLIEDGLYGGKGTDAHKAGVVCDTVGDPFKDTAGPALNPLIKVMNLVALLLAPIVIAPHSTAVQVGVTAVCLAALAFSVWWSKRGSMSSGMAAATADAAAHGAAPVATPKSEERGRITVDDE